MRIDRIAGRCKLAAQSLTTSDIYAQTFLNNKLQEQKNYPAIIFVSDIKCRAISLKKTSGGYTTNPQSATF